MINQDDAIASAARSLNLDPVRMHNWRRCRAIQLVGIDSGWVMTIDPRRTGVASIITAASRATLPGASQELNR
jgi:hypothetical protein